jgi:hypothetical protein
VIVILGLVILIAALIVAVVGVLSNSGSGHALPHDFAVLGYHVTGSTGTLFLYGIVVGAAGLLGLGLLLAGARRTSRRGRDARRGLRQSRRETAAVRQRPHRQHARQRHHGQRCRPAARASGRPARPRRPRRRAPNRGIARQREPAVSMAARIWHHHPNVPSA